MDDVNGETPAKVNPFARIGVELEHIPELLALIIERHFAQDLATFAQSKNNPPRKQMFDPFTGQPLA